MISLRKLKLLIVLVSLDLFTTVMIYECNPFILLYPVDYHLLVTWDLFQSRLSQHGGNMVSNWHFDNL